MQRTAKRIETNVLKTDSTDYDELIVLLPVTSTSER